MHGPSTPLPQTRLHEEIDRPHHFPLSRDDGSVISGRLRSGEATTRPPPPAAHPRKHGAYVVPIGAAEAPRRQPMQPDAALATASGLT
ncbi:hypothetical protein GUJ93_ZPchr0001g30139 [Zizania palustris]|uniref:Uncharacterized protein n=1 Tax=Zizania palustris TaxID=103762 RepID=A0A8J5S086_ZIZPA|nr:hypothetical protein GUJ93_ZPchr0001g30139 [Zizania palustris]